MIILSYDHVTKNHEQQRSGDFYYVSRGVVFQMLSRRRDGVSSAGLRFLSAFIVEYFSKNVFSILLLNLFSFFQY